MPEQSRIQVRKNDTENTWGDVGNKAGNESLPVNIKGFEVNNWETTGGVSYIGEETSGGDWRITLVTTATGEVEYASVVNNPTVTTYDDAWTDRAILTYGNISTT